ncbi:unnamed protein product [Ambrosiozyma monospora]|uniref:Unnamed protein product n=1 Tax=Ambrosiozyma monospora TaxID=43982 RepID=A0ACB5U9M4_AMBMO|nr:unnamed protein product [Ambrosiozyma monospora]
MDVEPGNDDEETNRTPTDDDEDPLLASNCDPTCDNRTDSSSNNNNNIGNSTNLCNESVLNVTLNFDSTGGASIDIDDIGNRTSIAINESIFNLDSIMSFNSDANAHQESTEGTDRDSDESTPGIHLWDQMFYYQDTIHKLKKQGDEDANLLYEQKCMIKFLKTQIEIFV